MCKQTDRPFALADSR